MAKDDKLDALIFGDPQDTSQGEGLAQLSPSAAASSSGCLRMLTYADVC
jgi:hypothetical protein